MVPAARWLVVAVIALVVTATPTLLRVVPASGSDITATALAAKIRRASSVGWSGEVHSQGSLSVPVGGSTFGGISRLLGDSADLRVWWHDPTRYRVARLRTSGESDLVRNGGTFVRWRYEDKTASYAPYSPVRLPEDVDVVPASLASRLLSGAHADELRRLPSRRIAGHSAAGLRLVPDDARSTIGAVDVWADDDSGVPLRVDVYSSHITARPFLSTEVTSFHRAEPDPRNLVLRVGPGVDYQRAPALDEAAGANAFAPFRPPSSVAGLHRLGDAADYGAVGVYGRGPTAVLAVPLRRSIAHGLQDQLDQSSSSRDEDGGTTLIVGPVSVLLTEVADGHFLVIGTVTSATLKQVAQDLASGVVRTFE